MNLRRPRLSVFGAALGMVLALVGPLNGYAQDSNRAVLLQQFADAFSRNDPEAAVAMVTDDVIFIAGPCGEAPGGMCVGKDQFRMATEQGGAQVSVTITELVGDTVRFRTEERFDFPPEARAAGVERFVEVGTIVFQGDKVALAGLVADVTDPQTVTLLRIFSSMGPPPGAAGP